MLHRTCFVLLLTFLGVATESIAGETKLPPIRPIDQIRLREAIRFVNAAFDSVWSTSSRPPLELLLVDDSVEYLISHSGPVPGFVSSEYDSILGQAVMARQRVFPASFLATFPAFSNISTIIVGRPENTLPKTSTPWVATIGHERLHQIQDAQPGMGQKVMALELHGGDSTGMWMLNYLFPYDSVPIAAAFDGYTSSLVAAVNGRGTSDFGRLLRVALAARDHLSSLLNAREYRYMAFQLWKEGIARYTEYRIPQAAAGWYVPTSEFSQLQDFQSFDSTARSILRNSLSELQSGALRNTHRIVFYATGLAEGLLLDECAPGWRKRYFTEPLDTRQYFDQHTGE